MTQCCYFNRRKIIFALNLIKKFHFYYKYFSVTVKVGHLCSVNLKELRVLQLYCTFGISIYVDDTNIKSQKLLKKKKYLFWEQKLFLFSISTQNEHGEFGKLNLETLSQRVHM